MRKIVSSRKNWDETVNLTPRTFYYRVIPVTTLVLECGHTKVYRGDYVPKHKALCHVCKQKAAHRLKV
jgi:hypothetical protein